MNQELSQRLKEVAQFVPSDSIVADIGTDHAYLPIYLVKACHAKKVIGSEVAEGPLENGRKNVKKAGLQNQIELRYGDGVSTLSPDESVDVITIAGMGGKTITAILATGLEQNILPVSRLILQPNTDEWLVRFWLWQHGYEIKEERILTERRGTYEIIVADYVGDQVSMNREDILFGPFLRLDRSEAYLTKYQQECDNLRRVIQKIPSNTARARYVALHLNEMEAMLDEYESK